MPFLGANIDRAIVVAQHGLRGYAYPLGSRQEYKQSASNLDTVTANFMSFAAGFDPVNRKPTDEVYASYFESSYEEYLAMCKQLAEDCFLFQEAAIQLIVLEIVKQSEEMKAEVAAGKRCPSPYLFPLVKSNRWGRAVLALAEAFEVSLEPAVA